MHFLNHLLALDRHLFFTINRGLSCPFLDWLMPLIRNQYFWAPVYAFFIVFFVVNYRQKGFLIILFALLNFALSDQLSAHWLKFVFERLRPCHDPQISDMVHLLIPCGGGYSFPSSHATNHFAFSLFAIAVMPRATYRWLIPFAMLWAAFVSIAQVYVGVHYPIDITAGAILGSIIGLATGNICRYVLRLHQE